jgi:hypothetical protein
VFYKFWENGIDEAATIPSEVSNDTYDIIIVVILSFLLSSISSNEN